MKKLFLLVGLCLLFSGCQVKGESTQPPTQPEIVITEEERLVEAGYGTIYCSDPSLPLGQQEVVFPGTPGTQRQIDLVTYENGAEISRETMETVPVSAPVDQIVAEGTGEAPGQGRRWPLLGEGFLVTPEGQCLAYTHTDQFRAVAYTSWVADTTGTTATGTVARVGAIAVDPSVIPYGTRMYIVTNDGEYIYGLATAEDCGGGIKGHIIDLFFDTLEECYAFGSRQCTVYFLA